ncbi:MAG: glucose-6-phosphate isomerase [Planctomycetes bacterium]|nr:glucose-6-phosphate isomerase [Planctomycetota bacterium]
MTTPPIQPIQYDPAAAIIPQHGLAADDLAKLAPRLEIARAEVLADAELWSTGGEVPSEKQPLDAGFMELPQRLLAEYRERREASELGRILGTASRLRESVDRVVVLGIGGSYMGARSLMDGCCHPYHNELPRSERGGVPRMYFEGNNVDNDASQGLLDLLGRGKPTTGTDDAWAIVVISKSGGTLETAAAFRQFLAALRTSVDDDKEKIAQRVVPVTGSSGRLFDLSAALGCPDVFMVPDGVGGRFSILSAVGLLPAAILGLDVVRLLEAAAAMNARFAEAPVGENPVLDYVGVSHLMERDHGATTRVLSVWAKGLESVGLWYDQLLAESLGKTEQHGATPLTVLNTRDLHSRGQQHQEGRRDKLITNVIVEAWRRDPLAIGTSALDQDQLNALAEKTLPKIMTAAIAGTNKAYAEDARPTTDLRLPQLDEASLGQLLQMLMLATVVEGRLIGVNPYGQPGVEAYKKHMNAFLRGA